MWYTTGQLDHHTSSKEQKRRAGGCTCDPAVGPRQRLVSDVMCGGALVAQEGQALQVTAAGEASLSHGQARLQGTGRVTRDVRDTGTCPLCCMFLYFTQNDRIIGAQMKVFTIFIQPPQQTNWSLFPVQQFCDLGSGSKPIGCLVIGY